MEARVSEERKPEGQESDQPIGDEIGRREALRKVGSLAVWTAPTLAVLSLEAKATPGSSQP
jgi:hypothetical protein